MTKEEEEEEEEVKTWWIMPLPGPQKPRSNLDDDVDKKL